MNNKLGFKTLQSYSEQSTSNTSGAMKNESPEPPLFHVPSTSNKHNLLQSNLAGPSNSSKNLIKLKRSLSNVSTNNITMARHKLVATEQLVPQKTTSRTSLRILTCSIKKIMELQKSHFNLSVLYEVFASVIKLHTGSKHPTEMVIALRDGGVGPVLQGIYYDTDSLFSDDIQVGSFVRCVGRFTSPARFQFLKISSVQQPNCDEFVRRLETLTNFELNNFLGKQKMEN